MRIGKKERSIKALLAHARRIDEINRILATRPAHPLPNKIFAGHWRYLAVRSDILRSSVGLQVQRVVDACNHWVLGRKSSTKSFLSSTEVAYGSGETGFSSGQGLRPLSQGEWDSHNFPEFYERRWFKRVPKIIRAGTKNISINRFFPQVPAYMLEFAYRPAYITETKTPDGDLESELRHLYQVMKENHGWEKISGRHADEWDLSIRRRKVRERLLTEELSAR